MIGLLRSGLMRARAMCNALEAVVTIRYHAVASDGRHRVAERQEAGVGHDGSQSQSPTTVGTCRREACLDETLSTVLCVMCDGMHAFLG